MSISAEQWLDLREVADARARNRTVAEAMRSWFLQRPNLSVIDLGCGTGANLRATATLLPDRQRWRLVDRDAALLASARVRLSKWADAVETLGETLVLTKGALRIEVLFARIDLALDLEPALAPWDSSPADLITASAVFDLTSIAFIRQFAAVAERQRAAVYATLTANGQLNWTPRHPTDRELLAGFHRVQMMDRGFGPAAGPTAAVELSEALTTQGFGVTEGASPWRCGAADKALVDELACGFARAVALNGSVPKQDMETWLKRPKSGAEVGHIDLFATPPMGKGASMGTADDED